MKRLSFAKLFIDSTFIASSFVAFNAHAGQVRNMKTVISGGLSGAGTTGRVQYNDTTLTELCNQSFTTAIFLYDGAHARTVSCGGGRQISYSSIAYQNLGSILGKVGSAMDSGGKALVHCFNGVHATQFIEAAALNRFCGFSGNQAAQWFVSRVPVGSLPQKQIDTMAGRLAALGAGGSVRAGCPHP